MSGPRGNRNFRRGPWRKRNLVLQRDGWSTLLYYRNDLKSYIIQSAGRDKMTKALVCGTTDFNADVAYSSGTFIQWPEGMQQ